MLRRHATAVPRHLCDLFADESFKLTSLLWFIDLSKRGMGQWRGMNIFLDNLESGRSDF